MIDEQLACGRRGLRTLPGTLLLGSTGDRLWVDYLEDRPGFAGAIDFIHKLNIPLLYAVAARGIAAPSDVAWRPSHSESRQRIGNLLLTERKFVTADDCAVSLQHWQNSGDAPERLTLEVDASWLAVDTQAGAATGRRDFPQRGFAVAARIETSEPRLFQGLELLPGESVEFAIAAALGLSDAEPLRERLATILDPAQRSGNAAVLAAQIEAYQAWFDRAPEFRSSDPLLDRAYAYRWFILRHNLVRPGLAPFDGPLFYEGRSHKMTKAPFAPSGWEFSKLIPLSSPMHLLDMRWYDDASYGAELLRILQSTQRDDGQLSARTLTETIHPYANFLGHAALQYGLARGLDAGLRDALPLLMRQVRGERDHLATGGDSLPIQDDHRLTGKEYQPSYWYFHGFPDDPFDKATYTPLKRVDRAIYQHLNARGVAELLALYGEDGGEFAAIAARVADDVLSKQWDAASGFFYDLHPDTDAKAMVMNIVGFYPWWAGLAGAGHRPGFRAALTAEHFLTRAPFPSVSVDCPVYQPGGSWKGRFLKGRNGCMWDGPTWPYTNSIVLDAIAAESLASNHEFDALFADALRKYLLLHYRDQDGVTPYLVEHYDSATGEPISDEPDYNHSYLIDLILRRVAGISFDAGPLLAVDPVDIGLEFFEVDNIVLRGVRIALRYRRTDGLRLVVDGVEVASRADLGRLEWSGLPAAKFRKAGE